MSGSEIAIIDYQMGNLRSVQKAFEHVGASAVVTSDPNRIAEAGKIVLPGVGAFGDAMRELTQRQLPPVILEAIRSGKPFLGICLGLQLLFDSGKEGGDHVGLGAIPGQVVRFAPVTGFKIPHMGWNRVAEVKPGCPLMAGIAPESHFYFVHSYYVEPTEASVEWLRCDYCLPFCAAVWRDNLFATQFHPEKSQRDGLKLFENFARL